MPTTSGLSPCPLFHVFGLNVALGLCPGHGRGAGPRHPLRRGRVARPGARPGRHDVARGPDHVRGMGRRSRRGIGAAPPPRRRAPGDLGRGGSRPRTWRRASNAATASPSGRDTASPRPRRPCRPRSARVGTGRDRSAGRCPGWRCSLVDEEGEPALDGDPGEIWVRGANVFAGYWNDPRGHGQGAGRRRMASHRRHRGDRGRGRPLRRGPIQGPRDRLWVQRVPGRGGTGGGFCSRCCRSGGDRQARRQHGRVRGGGHRGRPGQLGHRGAGARLLPRPTSTRYKCPTSIRFVTELPHGLTGKALEKGTAGPTRLSTRRARPPPTLSRARRSHLRRVAPTWCPVPLCRYDPAPWWSRTPAAFPRPPSPGSRCTSGSSWSWCAPGRPRSRPTNWRRWPG